MTLAHRATPRCRAAWATAQRLAPVVAEIQAGGIRSLEGIAREMMARGIPTPGGGSRWRSRTVARVLQRLEKSGDPPPRVTALVKLATAQAKHTSRPPHRPRHIVAAVVGALKAHGVAPPEGFAAWNAAALDASQARRRRHRKRVPVETSCC